MLAGKALYTDLWDHKPPAIYLTYAAAEVIAGYGRDSIFLLNISAAFATLLACYFAGSAAGGGRLGGLIAAALWALASGDLAIEGNQPNTEVFLNALLTSGFAILLRAWKCNLGLPAALLTGRLRRMPRPLGRLACDRNVRRTAVFGRRLRCGRLLLGVAGRNLFVLRRSNCTGRGGLIVAGWDRKWPAVLGRGRRNQDRRRRRYRRGD